MPKTPSAVPHKGEASAKAIIISGACGPPTTATKQKRRSASAGTRTRPSHKPPHQKQSGFSAPKRTAQAPQQPQRQKKTFHQDAHLMPQCRYKRYDCRFRHREFCRPTILAAGCGYGNALRPKSGLPKSRRRTQSDAFANAKPMSASSARSIIFRLRSFSFQQENCHGARQTPAIVLPHQ